MAKIDITESEVKKNFTDMTDMELRDELFERNIPAPLTEENRLIRKHAIAMLSRYDVDTKAAMENERLVRVVFTRSSHPSALKNCVYVNLNGREYRIPYDTEVVIPKSILMGVIDHANPGEYEVVEDPNRPMQKVWKMTTSKLYPYTVLGYADDAKMTEGLEVKSSK